MFLGLLYTLHCVLGAKFAQRAHQFDPETALAARPIAIGLLWPQLHVFLHEEMLAWLAARCPNAWHA
jgi:hypothetical protein